jgi:hypothetical protein
VLGTSNGAKKVIDGFEQNIAMHELQLYAITPDVDREQPAALNMAVFDNPAFEDLHTTDLSPVERDLVAE